MSKISYVCDIPALGKAFIDGNYESIRERIMSMSAEDGVFRCVDGEKYGYRIHTNLPLTSIYGFDVYMVDFVFSSVNTIHEDEQFEIIRSLVAEINAEIHTVPGYYIFRIPTDVIDLVRAFNLEMSGFYACGGTVSYISDADSCANTSIDDSIKIIYVDDEYLKIHRSEIASISEESFLNYQGQYHLSPVTAYKAHEIYVGWIDKSFGEGVEKERMIVAEINGEIAGFWSYVEHSDIIHTGLTATSARFRGRGVYKALLNAVLKLSDKKIVIGTQFDNYIVQNTWVNFKMHPFHGFYTFHVDGRKSC